MKGALEPVMIRTVEAIVDEHGVVRLLAPIQLHGPCRAILAVDDGGAGAGANDLARLSEASLAQDWNRPEEDAAWSHLQPGR
jgi:hypothetical protein